MCAFCKRGWYECYPVESTIEGRSYMELGVEWAEGRDMLTFGTIGGVRAFPRAILPDVRTEAEG